VQATLGVLLLETGLAAMQINILTLLTVAPPHPSVGVLRQRQLTYYGQDSIIPQAV
jgi:hypothetical protein